jgi:hypothetical protein
MITKILTAMPIYSIFISNPMVTELESIPEEFSSVPLAVINKEDRHQ